MEEMVDQSEMTQEELVDDLKSAGTTVTKKTISNTQRHDGSKSHRGHKVLCFVFSFISFTSLSLISLTCVPSCSLFP